MVETPIEKELRKALFEQLQDAIKHLNEPGLDLPTYHTLKGRTEAILELIEWHLIQKLEPKGKQVQLDTLGLGERISELEAVIKDLIIEVDNPAISTVEDACALLKHPQAEYYNKETKAMEKTNKCYCCRKEFKDKDVK